MTYDLIGLALPGAAHLFVVLAVLAATAFRASSAPAWRRLRYALAAAALWSWVFSSPGLANLALAALEGPPAAARTAGRPAGEPVIVVLASGRLFARDGTPAPRLDANGWERFRAGVGLWRETAGVLVFTGGPGPDESLAGLMRATALQSGVPPGAIRVVANSRSTYEDIALVREVVETRGRPVWLVTSAVHMPRALAVSRKLGLDAKPFPCDFRQIDSPTWRAWLPDDGGPELWSSVLHEVAGLQYYRLRGWAD
ncbi:MAG: YdcF family protein [Lysobacter sp.]|nr:YdcF family protein [Lysobacter sp.]